MNVFVQSIGEKVLGGKKISFPEAQKLLQVDMSDFVDLIAVANRVRHQFVSEGIDLCTIINAKSGRCSEDCRFCVQSAHHHGVCETYPMVSVDEIVRAAHDAEEQRIQRFSIVTSGRALNSKDFQTVIEAARQIRKQTALGVDCSLGMISHEKATVLKKAGADRYHHNLETSRSFFEKICTTHSYSDKLTTIEAVKESGLSICSGGIIGLGEAPEQWLEMIFQLRDLEVDCIPVNILNPRPGTPLEATLPPSPLEIIKLIAITRLIVPNIPIKLAGGRETNLRDFQATAFLAGVTGMIVGGYLTTGGRRIDQDLKLLEDLGPHPRSGHEKRAAPVTVP